MIIITMALHAHISPGGWTVGPLVAAALRRKSHPTDMINRSTYSTVLQICWRFHSTMQIMQLSDMSEAHTGLYTPPSTNTWITWTSIAHHVSITKFSSYIWPCFWLHYSPWYALDNTPLGIHSIAYIHTYRANWECSWYSMIPSDRVNLLASHLWFLNRSWW
jgi:hypothetical protein